MAKTVGLPAAMVFIKLQFHYNKGAELLLSGVAKGKGVIAPVTADVYEPILQKLELEGINFEYK